MDKTVNSDTLKHKEDELVSPLVLATRPQAQNGAWGELLRVEGYDVIDAPLMEVVPLVEEAAAQLTKNKIMNLDQYQKLIFVSQNAVHYGFEWIDQYWPQFPDGVTCYAVGVKTAELIRQHIQGYTAQIGVAEDAMTSEELLSLPSLSDEITDSKVLLFRGKGGRTKLQSTLESRGAVVESCELYERKSLSIELKGITDGRLCVVPVFSGETLVNLHQNIKHLDNWPRQIVIVPSERVALQAKELGFINVFRAKNAASDSMLAALNTAVKSSFR